MDWRPVRFRFRPYRRNDRLCDFHDVHAGTHEADFQGDREIWLFLVNR